MQTHIHTHSNRTHTHTHTHAVSISLALALFLSLSVSLSGTTRCRVALPLGARPGRRRRRRSKRRRCSPAVSASPHKSSRHGEPRVLFTVHLILYAYEMCACNARQVPRAWHLPCIACTHDATHSILAPGLRGGSRSLLSFCYGHCA